MSNSTGSHCVRGLSGLLDLLAKPDVLMEFKLQLLLPVLELLQGSAGHGEEIIGAKVMAVLSAGQPEICSTVVDRFLTCYPHATNDSGFQHCIEGAVASDSVEIRKFAMRYLVSSACLVGIAPRETDPELFSTMIKAVCSEGNRQGLDMVSQMIDQEEKISLEKLNVICRDGLYHLAIHGTTAHDAIAILRRLASDKDGPWGFDGCLLASDVVSNVAEKLATTYRA